MPNSPPVVVSGAPSPAPVDEPLQLFCQVLVEDAVAVSLHEFALDLVDLADRPHEQGDGLVGCDLEAVFTRLRCGKPDRDGVCDGFSGLFGCSCLSEMRP